MEINERSRGVYGWQPSQNQAFLIIAIGMMPACWRGSCNFAATPRATTVA